jgi:hypothetical protein
MQTLHISTNQAFRQYKKDRITVKQFSFHGNVIPSEIEITLKAVFIMSEATLFQKHSLGRNFHSNIVLCVFIILRAGPGIT